MEQVYEREYVTVARGRGRRWVVAASERGRAWVIVRTPSRVLVGYLTGTGRQRSIWIPKEAVTRRSPPMPSTGVDFINAEPAPVDKFRPELDDPQPGRTASR